MKTKTNSQEWQIRGLGFFIILALLTPGIIKKYKERVIWKEVKAALSECIKEYNETILYNTWDGKFAEFVKREKVAEEDIGSDVVKKFAIERVDKCMEKKVGEKRHLISTSRLQLKKNDNGN